MSAKRILIIDDEYRIREIIKLTLEMMAGWEILMAGSGAEGLSIAEAEQPDAILLDMMMPEMDGTATLSYLQANVATQHIPVLLLTAKLPVSGEPQFIQLGAKAVIPKPFDPLFLANQIADVLGWQL